MARRTFLFDKNGYRNTLLAGFCFLCLLNARAIFVVFDMGVLGFLRQQLDPFQADYFLKELALGEYTMPVSGMLSVFDWSEMIENDKEWAGREWFVVKKAWAGRKTTPSLEFGGEPDILELCFGWF